VRLERADAVTQLSGEPLERGGERVRIVCEHGDYPDLGQRHRLVSRLLVADAVDAPDELLEPIAPFISVA
jgi:hypothetical protein